MQPQALNRRLPVGAEALPDGGVHFRVWAPRRKKVSLVLEEEPDSAGAAPSSDVQLSPEGNGYFSGVVTDAAPGALYRFRLDEEETLFPDPASRFQPYGPLGPSQVVDPSLFQWTDRDWPGVEMKGLIFYEAHIGAFTKEGTFREAVRHFPELAETGVNLIEVMPVSDFAGEFGWGYDGVDLYAPTRLYGNPDDFRFFVDQAHAHGLGVILDVVYNHLGPVGNYLIEYSLDYFSDRYATEWGDALNFDGGNSAPVREFIIHNAGYWIDEFHLDGLRIDATQQMFDSSREHVIAAIARHARSKAGRRSIVIIAENEPQNTALVRSPQEGGYGLDGLLNDDFHHTAMVALTGRNEAYYMDYLGAPQELISSVKWGYLYQGQYYAWQKKRRGTSAFKLDPSVFINFLQNHDQIANSALGKRCQALSSPGRYRALTALLLLSPSTPLLFMGQEFSSSSLFSYFADHKGELARLVREGRMEFLKQFKSIASPDVQAKMPDPSDPETFKRCKLDHSEREKNRESYALHRDLIRLRRSDPVFRAQRRDWMHAAVIGPEAFCLRFFGEEDGDRLVLVNLGRDLNLLPAPEPLLAPPEDSHWELLWSSEAVRYGGSGAPPLEPEGVWRIPGHAAFVLAPLKVVRSYNA